MSCDIAFYVIRLRFVCPGFSMEAYGRFGVFLWAFCACQKEGLSILLELWYNPLESIRFRDG